MASYYILHRTVYEYSQPVSISNHLAYLEPLSGDRQRLKSHQFDIDPKPSEEGIRQDFFGNRQRFFQVQVPHSKISMVVESRVEVVGPPMREGSMTVGEVRNSLRTGIRRELLDARFMCFPSLLTGFDEALIEFGRPHLAWDRPFLAGVKSLMAAIYSQFEFSPGATDISTPVLEVLRLRRGVCQDFAHLMLSVLRSYGLPACYVSGYILTQPPPGQPRLEGADASHAWVSVYEPGVGWVDFDPTNNLVCGEDHITVARGRDFGDVSPVKGNVVGGGEQKIKIEVTVKPEE